ncbi:MAG: hypothetical protein E7258_07060 [Lachnospiraceae bacterium]|nr:hypothetical protein [Lachnospiraceae bacterium]
MKKKIYLLALSVVLVFSMVGCGKDDNKKEPISVKEDLVEFVNEELPTISSYRSDAITAYNGYFVTDDVDTTALLTDLQTNIIPNMESYIAGLTAIEVETTEVISLKDLYMQGAQTQLDAMKMVEAAITEENQEYLAQADALILEAQGYYTQYETELKSLAAENNVNISTTAQ